MKVTGDWIKAEATQRVCACLRDVGFQALFVGGCVRNALLDEPVGDIDIATDALPAEVMAASQAVGLKSVPTGLDHGTVTVISDHVPHEVTTFRRDVETHGRRATVAFSDDILQDASRRDFTMNALYAQADGTVIDPLGGIEDLKARRVRFIGDAGQRIREDYLRILRFFRFHAWYGDPDCGIDTDGLAAIGAHLDGLAGLSRERIGVEILKLLTAANPAPSVASMRAAGVLHRVLPGAEDHALAALVHLEEAAHVSPDPIRRLTVLGGEESSDHIRLSRSQSKMIELLKTEVASTKKAGELGYRYGAQTAMDILLLRAALFEQPLSRDARVAIQKGVSSEFPVRAEDLMPDVTGPALGARLKTLEQRWIDSDFSLSRQDLLA